MTSGRGCGHDVPVMTILIINIAAGLALCVSLAVSRKKTLSALKTAWKRFYSLLPAFLLMLSLVALVLAIVSDELIIRLLGRENLAVSAALAALIGSAVFMPGFVAFPLAGILLGKGVPYTVLSAFTTTLMMVGVLTFPLERSVMGTRAAVLRNGISFFIALAVALATGLVFGELL